MAELASAAFARLLAIVKSPDYVEVAVGEGLALVDSDDAGLVSAHKWYNRSGYAVTQIDGKMIQMHVLLMGKVEGREIDHKDGNPLNNRRSNLRFCTKRQNAQNRHVVCGRSRFKGVRRDRGQWRTEIKVDGRKVHVGVFPTERLAARAYDQAAREMFGEFAKTNADLGLY